MLMSARSPSQPAPMLASPTRAIGPSAGPRGSSTVKRPSSPTVANRSPLGANATVHTRPVWSRRSVKVASSIRPVAITPP
jgi:hypothetical protein